MALIYCKECGKLISDSALNCPYCGCIIKNANSYTNVCDKSSKDWLTTLLLCFFLGSFGIHSFYVGKTLIGIIQLITLGCCGIWTLVDLIMIICGSYKDGEGKLVRNN